MADPDKRSDAGDPHRPIAPPLSDRAIVELRRLLGPDGVVIDADVRARVEVDWTGRFRGSTPALLRPRTVEDVSAVLAWCDAERVAVTPQGGNTGLVGGGVPLHGEVVLSLSRLDAISEVDPLGGQLTAGAGATLAAVQSAASAHGLLYPVDLAARDTASIGGTVATNAGGVHLLRYGGTRRQLLGVEAVRADGQVLSHLAGLEKDNTGYDIAQLLCGSEGTLAVVTAARLRLVPAPGEVAVALLAFAGASEAIAAVARLRRRLPELRAAELMTGAGVDLVCRAFDRRSPFVRSWPFVVLVEVAGVAPDLTARDLTDGGPGVVASLAAAVADLPAVGDSAVADDHAGRAELWALREDHTLAINTLGAPHKLDVTLPLPVLASFLAEVTDAVRSVAPASSVWLFGHVADGNIHVNITGAGDIEGGNDTGDAVDDVVLELVARRGGSISAEHGIGTAKRRWLHLNRSPSEIDTFRRIKAALDPNGILNPHVLLPD